LIVQTTFIAEEAHWLNRPGRADVEGIGFSEDIQPVKVGGQAITGIRGEFI
jgi:trans-2,3-dihydro-3-hydroxyanthranilate isomerase